MAPRRGARRQADSDEEMDVDEGNDIGGDVVDDTSRKANQLVRLALFHEHRRIVLKRDEITKKVMGGSKNFAQVFQMAQEILRRTFGMEMAELKTRTDLENGGADEELDEARKATGAKKKAASGTKAFILRSTLHPGLIQIANQTDEQIIEQEAEDADPDADDEDTPRSYGTLVHWNESGSLGILYTILALILVSGRTLSDPDLRSYLKKLRLGMIKFSPHSTTPSVNLDSYLQTLMRQGFIDRQTIGETKAKKKATKRVRGDEEEAQKYEWRWGARAHSEIGEEMIGTFVAEFMVAADEDQEDGEEGREAAKRKEQRVGKVLNGIGKAAGGGLSEIR